MNIQNRLTLKWIVLTFVLLPVLVLLGLFMRTIQSNYLPEYQAWFYPVMTLHGVSMAGLWYVGSIACASAVLSHHVKIDPFIDRFAFAGTVIGVLLLLMSILGGRFGAACFANEKCRIE
jgi:predicted membrane protein